MSFDDHRDHSSFMNEKHEQTKRFAQYHIDLLAVINEILNSDTRTAGLALAKIVEKYGLGESPNAIEFITWFFSQHAVLLSSLADAYQSDLQSMLMEEGLYAVTMIEKPESFEG